MNLGILSVDFIDANKEASFTQETNDIIVESRKIFDNVFIIDPSKIILKILDNKPSIGYEFGRQNHIFENINALLVRRTRGFSEQVHDIVHFVAKAYPNILLFDPLDSYVRPLSKVLSLLNRSSHFQQPNTYITLHDNVDFNQLDIIFPIIIKPTHGFRGIDVKRCNDYNDLRNYINEIRMISKQNLGYGHLIQTYIEIKEEYRIVVIGGRSIGCVRKLQDDPSKYSNNAFQGARFESCTSEDAMKLAEECTNLMNLSFSGVDIVRDKNNNLLILECNRNPQYNQFEKATGINVSELIVAHIISELKISESTKNIDMNQIKKSVMNDKIFIGSCSGRGKNIANYVALEFENEYDPTVWDQGVFELSNTTIESLIKAANTFDYAILLLTPDDLTKKKDSEIFAPRDNVIFELGLFIGKLGRDRTYIIVSDDFDLKAMPSDLFGVTVAKMAVRTDGNIRAQVRSACLKVKEKMKLS